MLRAAFQTPHEIARATIMVTIENLLTPPFMEGEVPQASAHNALEVNPQQSRKINPI
jgi:hypothetical protein